MTDQTKQDNGTKPMKFGIDMTERAATAVKSIFAEKSLDAGSVFLRIGVTGGGCSGFNYTLDITPTAGKHDNKFDAFGIQLLCDPKSYLYLNGTTIDFKDDMVDRRFVFDNPNASRSCGCGSSFAV